MRAARVLAAGSDVLLIVASRAEAGAVATLAQNRVGARFDAMAGQVVTAVDEVAGHVFAELQFHPHGCGLGVAVRTEALVVALHARIGGRMRVPAVLPDEVAGM